MLENKHNNSNHRFYANITTGRRCELALQVLSYIRGQMAASSDCGESLILETNSPCLQTHAAD